MKICGKNAIVYYVMDLNRVISILPWDTASKLLVIFDSETAKNSNILSLQGLLPPLQLHGSQHPRREGLEGEPVIHTMIVSFHQVKWSLANFEALC